MIRKCFKSATRQRRDCFKLKCTAVFQGLKELRLGVIHEFHFEIGIPPFPVET